MPADQRAEVTEQGIQLSRFLLRPPEARGHTRSGSRRSGYSRKIHRQRRSQRGQRPAPHGDPIPQCRHPFGPPGLSWDCSAALMALVPCSLPAPTWPTCSSPAASPSQQEFAVRTALGADQLALNSPARWLRAVCSAYSARQLDSASPPPFCGRCTSSPKGMILPRASEIHLRFSVLAMLAVIAIAVTLLSSLLPVLLAWRVQPEAALRAQSRASTPHAARSRLAGWLVSGEVAIAAILLVATGLLFHTLYNLEHQRLGFETEHVITFTIQLHAGFGRLPHLPEFCRQRRRRSPGNLHCQHDLSAASRPAAPSPRSAHSRVGLLHATRRRRHPYQLRCRRPAQERFREGRTQCQDSRDER